MKVTKVSVWDEGFFQKFLEFKASIHRDIATSFPEELSDYAKFFGQESPFREDFTWVAFLVESEEGVVAKAVLTWKKNAVCGNLGFLDWVNSPAAAKTLMTSVEAEANNLHFQEIKTPIDMTFFNKYRIRLPGGGKPLWGEPIYPDYYHELFKATGFQVVHTWQSYRLMKLAGIIDYASKRKLLKRKYGAPRVKEEGVMAQIRNVNLSEWDRDLRIIYDLFTTAYKEMPEFESITYSQFKLLYDDFRYIMNPLYSYLFEYDGKPVGFSINYVDPLPVLLSVKGKKLNAVQKALLLVKLRLNRSAYVIAHVGKVPGPNGESIKGVQIQASTRISLASVFMKKVYSTFHSENSPARRSFNYSTMEEHASYVLYGKKLK